LLKVSTMPVIKLAYIRRDRFFQRCKILVSPGSVRIIIFPVISNRLVKIKGQLSIKELHTLLTSKGITELKIRTNDVLNIRKYPLRRSRKDFANLFPEEIRGNISEVLIKLRNGKELCLILFEKDLNKLVKSLNKAH